MASNCVVRYLNVKDVYNAAMHNLRIKGLIDSNKYKILMSGIRSQMIQGKYARTTTRHFIQPRI